MNGWMQGGLALGAVLINILLYLLMEAMIKPPQADRMDFIETRPIEFLRTVVEEQTRARDRRPPPPPKPAEVQRPRTRMDTAFNPQLADLPMDVAAMDVTSLLGLGVGVGLASHLLDGSAGFAGGVPAAVDVSTLFAISMLPPQYPPHALSRRLEGWVEVLFRVDAQGQARDPQVLAAAPPGVFDQAATAAVERWRFRPPQAAAAGEPLYARVRLNFRIPAEDG